MSLTPLADRILIKPDVPSDETASGLVLVRDHTPEIMGTVVAVPTRVETHCPDCGSRVWTPPSVRVGDTVLFGYDAGQELTVDGERFLLIRDTDLIAVLEDTVTHG